MLIVAVVSLIVAGSAYRFAQESGAQETTILERQRGVLEESEKALHSVVQQLDNQRKLLDETLEASSAYLDLMRQAYEAEQKRLARRPLVSLGVGTIPENQLNLRITASVDGSAYTPIDFLVRNTGNVDLESPTVILRASPPTLRINPRGLRTELAGPALRFSGQTVGNVRPFSLARVPSAFQVDVQVPSEVEQFDIEVQIFGRNLPATTRTFHFQAIRRR